MGRPAQGGPGGREREVIIEVCQVTPLGGGPAIVIAMIKEGAAEGRFGTLTRPLSELPAGRLEADLLPAADALARELAGSPVQLEGVRARGSVYVFTVFPEMGDVPE